MIFDKLGLPRDTGATDWNDSARLAGIMVLFNYSDADKINLELYIKNDVYTRHPEESTYNFSRDQAVCLMSGLFKSDNEAFVNADYITGNDFLSPSVLGHIKRCQAEKASWLQNQWLKLDIMYNGLFTPRAEQNQLMCMCVVAGPEYVSMYKRWNNQWQKAVTDYWCGWRGEPELAEHIIKTLNG